VPPEGDPRRIDDPWFAGLHTVFPIDAQTCLASASGPDAFLWVDMIARRVIRRLRLPEDRYGRNYALGDDTSVRDRYIVNDLQIAHMNCAYPMVDGSVVYSTLIQGDVGRWRPDGTWHQYRQGHIGCHGARVSDDGGTIYFVDSTQGRLVAMNGQGEIEKTIQRPSLWLHDAQQLPGTPYFLLCESDFNILSLVDSRDETVLFERSWPQRGASTQFLHARRAV
jgi:hypothetical protein